MAHELQLPLLEVVQLFSGQLPRPPPIHRPQPRANFAVFVSRRHSDIFCGELCAAPPGGEPNHKRPHRQLQGNGPHASGLRAPRRPCAAVSALTHLTSPPPAPQLWLVFFYLLAAVLVISLGLCVFVASCFKSGSFPVVWPVKLLRALVSVVFSVLFVSSLGEWRRSPLPSALGRASGVLRPRRHIRVTRSPA